MRKSNAVCDRYGYASIYEMQEVVDNYTDARIPLDVMWGDIDYMERWRDFTFDHVNYPQAAVKVCRSYPPVAGSPHYDLKRYNVNEMGVNCVMLLPFYLISMLTCIPGSLALGFTL